MRAIITGGSGALGSAAVRAFLDAGHEVVSIDHGTRAPPGVRSIGGVDLVSGAAAARAFDSAVALLGGVEVLVNVAGGYASARFDGATDVWERMFALNLRTCLNMCRTAASRIADGGAIVNVGAAASGHATAGNGPYAASKSAVARLTESLAAELRGRVRVNAVLPGTMDTPANRAAMPSADFSNWTAPAAVAAVILFLASDAGCAINGALLPVTAGTAR